MSFYKYFVVFIYSFFAMNVAISSEKIKSNSKEEGYYKVVTQVCIPNFKDENNMLWMGAISLSGNDSGSEKPFFKNENGFSFFETHANDVSEFKANYWKYGEINFAVRKNNIVFKENDWSNWIVPSVISKDDMFWYRLLNDEKINNINLKDIEFKVPLARYKRMLFSEYLANISARRLKNFNDYPSDCYSK